MAKLIGLPRLSPTMEEGTLSRWLKHEGEQVNVDDVLAEVETDKATMEWHSFDSGILLKLLVPEGTLLSPDDPVAILGTPGEDIDALLRKRTSEKEAAPERDAPHPDSSPSGPESGSAEERGNADPRAEKRDATQAKAPETERDATQANATEDRAASRNAKRDATPSKATEDRAASRDAKRDDTPSKATDEDTGANVTRLVASPSVRRLAREHGLDLGQIRGSGPSGRIIQRDLTDALESRTRRPTSSQPPPSENLSEPQRPSPRAIPLSGSRRTIARRLTESKQTIPHYYVSIDVDASPLRKGLHELNASQTEGAPRVSVNDVILRACAQTLRIVPEVNVSLKAEMLLYHQVVDIAVAIAVDDGLMAPVVRDADAKGVLAIGREVRNLVNLAREKKLKPEHMAGGTFCVSNLGMYDIHSFSAIINPPQAAILAVGAIRDEPVVVDGQVRPGAKMHLTLSCDHRLIDGAVGARWLRTLGDLLETPLRMLL
ncbi:MAG: dihydrolipoamide acetyltransferase family protein [Polyangiaceae bacterium]